MQAEVTEAEIRAGLQRLGLAPGSAVVVHSSLRSFGHVRGGADAVVRAVLQAVGPDGLVIMPVYRCSFDARGDLLRTPLPSAPVSTGAIPAAFGQRSDVFLTDHPLYSTGFWGQDAEALAHRHSRLMFPYGEDQPLNCLRDRRGCILQLGVDDSTNTSIHVAEEIADPPYLAEKKTQSHLGVEEFFAMPVEARRESLAHHRAGPRRDFRKATPLIEAAGIRRTTRIGECRAALTDFVAMCELLILRLRREPDFLVVNPHAEERAR